MVIIDDNNVPFFVNNKKQKKKTCCDPLLEPSCQNRSNEGHNMFSVRNKKTLCWVTFKIPPYAEL